METHSSILTWEISYTEEPGRLQSWGCKESDMTEHTRIHIHAYTDLLDLLGLTGNVE